MSPRPAAWIAWTMWVVDSEEVVDGWVGVVSETMQPASVAVWVREG